MRKKKDIADERFSISCRNKDKYYVFSPSGYIALCLKGLVGDKNFNNNLML